MRSVLYRLAIVTLFAILLLGWMGTAFYPSAGNFLQWTAVVYLGLLSVQFIAVRFKLLEEQPLLLFQFSGDVLAVGLLIYATGGISSPFSFLLGLIVLASGVIGRVMLPITVSILVCIVYLVAVNIFAGIHGALDASDALHALLQTSAFFLVGGVMAFIARRHAGLRETSDRVVRQHRKLKGLHSRVMSSMSEGVIVLDGQLGLSEMNESSRVLLAAQDDPDEVLLARLFEHLPSLKSWMSNPGAGDFHAETNISSRSLLINAKALDHTGSNAVDPAWLLTLVDISDLRRLEHQLLEQEKMAALGQMSAMLAHEIRNPIQTMAQGLELMKVDAKHRQQIQGILHDEMLRLNRLVNMMLNYSKPLEAKPTFVNMADVMDAAIRQADLKVEAIQWQCKLGKLWIDSDHFRLVLDNLLSNAMKNRTEETIIHVELSGINSHWMLKVCNQGGLKDEVREHLFQPYVSGSSRGIGLGLSTVKQVCELNHWLVEVDEQDGQVCFMVKGQLCEQRDREMHDG